jgi:hypothetical protein
LPFTQRLDGGAWTGALTYTNINTQAPDFTHPNEAYWTHVDALLAYAQTKGMLCFMFPSYVGYGGGDQGWMQEMVANGQTRMQTYGAWIATRYQARTNIVWMLGGDIGFFTAPQQPSEQGLLTGLQSVPNQQSRFYSAEWGIDMLAVEQNPFGAAMNLNGAYSWVHPTSDCRRAYAYVPQPVGSPFMPAFLLEEPYDEEGPDGNNVDPYATQPVRRFQWWAQLSTIGGYIAGNGYVWRFNAGWQTHMNSQGGQDMGRLNAFVRSIPWYQLVPSGLAGTGVIVTAGGSSALSDDYITAAATPDGSLMVAYVPPAHTGTFTVDMTRMGGTSKAYWFNPVTAATIQIGFGIPNTGTRVFTPPGNNGSGYTDWVLVVQSPTFPTAVVAKTTRGTLGQNQTVQIGETQVLGSTDSGNGNMLLAQDATLGQAATIQSLSFYVTAPSGSLRLGIYDATGPGGGPGTLKAQTGAFTPVVGWNTSNVTTPVALPVGTYWLAYLPSSSTLNFAANFSAGSYKLANVAFGPMPATFPAVSQQGATHWSFYGTLTSP